MALPSSQVVIKELNIDEHSKPPLFCCPDDGLDDSRVPLLFAADF
jgi:hypothetical protein